MNIHHQKLAVKIFAAIMLSVFSSTALSDKNPADDFLNMTGTTAVAPGYIQNRDVEIVRDVKISELRIRHSRLIGGAAWLDCDRGHQEMVEIDGPFNAFTSDALERTFAGIEPCVIGNDVFTPHIYLSSGGGRLVDGLKVGKLIRKHGFITYIPFASRCASSCAIAFMGGRHRYLARDAKLSLHAPYFLPSGKQMSAELRATWVSRLGISCVTEMSELRQYFTSMLSEKTGTFLYEQTMGFCSTVSGWNFNKDAAVLYDLDNIAQYVDPLTKYRPEGMR